MNYTKEQCLFFLKNTELLEKTPELVETVQAALFKAINARVEKCIKPLGGWKGCYALVTGNAAKDEETAFAPAAWPENKDGSYRASYTFWGNQFFFLLGKKIASVKFRWTTNLPFAPPYLKVHLIRQHWCCLPEGFWLSGKRCFGAFGIFWPLPDQRCGH